ncbi:glycoside hydrolase family 3 protein [Aquisalinus flavus]|uniref:1,4-beta-D-glucan glucohydrolase n=1 Tax=Aquisalinus flavus TaxID=1526572 RepID=A0A8J2V660_9PROT|nr:glycoside hydrolase family 3 protein [Aquisalinus flavus]MBD0427368.1 glycoside hydrolase family 3 C-terminal domain-containing protein [Aquisalinus flavus]UNE47173.1 glycoside hydrolase family 3 protein [Aquisalinus flavus]GGD00462.1 1,4-beta-D-glucan glucohydrolase [Aquisalinus flavus]
MTRSDDLMDPGIWPAKGRPARNAKIEAQVADLLERMSLEEKVGQVIQADLASVTPQEARDYHLGSILNGGNSAPAGNNRAAPADFLDLVDSFYRASVDATGGRIAIPILWGTDAVHGHNNIVGATIFPHNIGLGAARDPDLIRRIGEVTALEVRTTGMDWTFAPTLAVARDDRWGRTYESYGEHPDVIASYAAAMVVGLQGRPDTDDFLSDRRVLATAKHFVGDGGTENGADQGDCRASNEDMRDIHAAGYPPALEAGVQTVMASFNTWHGRKMHGCREMLNDVLVDRLGFDGFVVGDWNGHGQVEGCTATSAAAAFNAGLDMFMAPDSWKGLYETTLDDVRAGRISAARLDEAVARILRVKMRLGLFEAKPPRERALAGEFSLLGSDAHRVVARDAVRKSLVLLKNDGVLPIRPNSRILVCGDGADNIGMQCGGWTLSWQGTDNVNSDFPNGQSIFAAVTDAVANCGGSVELSPRGTWSQKPDTAIVVFGEYPYAEFQGDRDTVDFSSDGPLQLMKSLQADAIPVVAVFLSGRPLWVNPELNASNAFVAAFLPGSEGAGIADLLIGDMAGNARHDFSGKLSFSWPRHPRQSPLNVGDADYDPLFAYGYGLSITDSHVPVDHDESCALPVRGSYRLADLFIAGQARGGWQLLLAEGDGDELAINAPKVASASGHIRVEARDHKAQEDTRLATWYGPASLLISGPPTDFSREVNAQMSLILTCRVISPPAGPVMLTMRDGDGMEVQVDIAAQISSADDDWQTVAVPLSYFVSMHLNQKAVTQPFGLYAEDPWSVQIEGIRVGSWEGSENHD